VVHRIAILSAGATLVFAFACKKKDEVPERKEPVEKKLTTTASDTTATASVSCATGATCFATSARGHRRDDGKYTSQCRGRFPDFVDLVPADYSGERFKLAQEYPATIPPHANEPWLQHDFKTPQGADAYLAAIFDYVAVGMNEVDWRAENNTKRRWYHVPWMTAGAHPREFLRGMTEERPVRKPELGLKEGAAIQNWAVGFYNDVGGYTIGRVWGAESPDIAKGEFPVGTVVAKILFSDVTESDFEDGVDLLKGAPEAEVNLKVRGKEEKKIQKMRLMQIDVAVRDPRATETGWVFGTFAYDKDAGGTDAWKRMKPVGLMWGNDPGLAQNKKPTQTIVSAQAPAYAKQHLGFADRMNGPVDNPVSSCLSCHSTAQYPNQAPMTWDSMRLNGQCDTYAERMQWFRNLKPTDMFGEIDRKTCALVAGTSGGPDPEKPDHASFDYSLQLAVSVLAYKETDKNGNRVSVNPCAEEMVAAKDVASPSLTDRTNTIAPKDRTNTNAPTSSDEPPGNRYPIER
jgi:hypothetical protein